MQDSDTSIKVIEKFQMDVLYIVTDVGTALGIEVQETDISAAYRVPSFRRDGDPAIVVQYTSRVVKENWISKSRLKKRLTAREVNQHFPVKQVFVGDHLTPKNKQLLVRLKKRGKELGYAFVWCRDGKFFARKAEGEPVKKINTDDDLDKLK